MMNFTNDEMNLLCIYQTGSRRGLIAALTKMRGYLAADEAELRELTDSALRKFSGVTDEQFADGGASVARTASFSIGQKCMYLQKRSTGASCIYYLGRKHPKLKAK